MLEIKLPNVVLSTYLIGSAGWCLSLVLTSRCWTIHRMSAISILVHSERLLCDADRQTMILVLPVIVFLAMFLQDSAAAMRIDPLDQHRPSSAGLCELVNDWGAVFSIGISGASMLKYGASPQTVAILLALGCASVLGTKLGDWLVQRKQAKNCNQVVYTLRAARMPF